MINRLGNLHGGCVATLIDICSSFSIIVGSGKSWNLIGISTDLSVAYLRGIAEGETIIFFLFFLFIFVFFFFLNRLLYFNDPFKNMLAELSKALCRPR